MSVDVYEYVTLMKSVYDEMHTCTFIYIHKHVSSYQYVFPTVFPISL